MVSLEKWMILTPLQKLTKNGEDWGKLIVAKGFKMLPKVQNIAQSGHTAWRQLVKDQSILLLSHSPIFSPSLSLSSFLLV